MGISSAFFIAAFADINVNNDFSDILLPILMHSSLNYSFFTTEFTIPF